MSIFSKLFKKTKRNKTKTNNNSKASFTLELSSENQKPDTVRNMLIIFADDLNMFDSQQIYTAMQNFSIPGNSLIYKCCLHDRFEFDFDPDTFMEKVARFVGEKYLFSYDAWVWQVIQANSNYTGKRAIFLCNRHQKY